MLVRIKDPRDREAWDQFVEIYAPLVYQMARRRGLQDADAADLTQDVLRSVSEAVGRLDYDRRKGTFRSWLYTVTRNALRHVFRSPAAVAARNRRLGRAGMAGGPASRGRGVGRMGSRIPATIARLRGRAGSPLVRGNTWQAFWQTAVEGKQGKDVARRLGMTIGAVYIAKSRVLSRIKEHIHQLLEE